MQISKLKNAGKNGWYIGDFDDAVIKSTAVEVCYCTIKEGYTDPHYHTKCTEILLVTKGKGIINGKKIKKGEVFSTNNIKCVRPGYGLDTIHFDKILNKRAKKNINEAQALNWSHILK